MKRNTQIIVLTVLLMVFCVCLFAACQTKKVDYFTYSADNMGVMGKLVKAMHGWIGNYGWTVVVFTVFLKIIMIPLDLWQRVSSKKSSMRMQKMQPLLAEIDKRYGANTPRANEEKQKLYKKQGFSAFSMCLPMIVSMVIFFVMFGGLRDYSTYSSVTSFQNLSETYFTTYYEAVQADGGEKWDCLNNAYNKALAESTEQVEKAKEVNARLVGINELGKKYPGEFSTYTEKALAAVEKEYASNHESWLWIQNVWQPDTWASIMPKYDDKTNGFSSTVDMSAFGTDGGKTHYELVRSAVIKNSRNGKGTWNGLMLLPFASIGLSFLSIFISQRLDKKRRGDQPAQAPAQDAQQAATNKTMMIMMPLMMAFFGFMYTGAFAIYMVSNYLLSILSTLAMSPLVDKMVQKGMDKLEAKENSNKASYMR